LNSITIVPSAGHCGAELGYSVGLINPTHGLTEVKIIDSIVSLLVERFLEWGVSYTVMPTRRPPGIPEDSRPAEVPKDSYPIYIGLGWYDTPRKKNCSELYYSDQSLTIGKGLAEAVGDALSIWGTCANFDHALSTPEPTDAIPDGLIVVPFAINGPGVEHYLPRLGHLGWDLAGAIIEYISSRFTHIIR
jgi:hypothetical protein